MSIGCVRRKPKPERCKKISAKGFCLLRHFFVSWVNSCIGQPKNKDDDYFRKYRFGQKIRICISNSRSNVSKCVRTIVFKSTQVQN
jgi:hypothetical protein